MIKLEEDRLNYIFSNKINPENLRNIFINMVREKEQKCIERINKQTTKKEEEICIDNPVLELNINAVFFDPPKISLCNEIKNQAYLKYGTANRPCIIFDVDETLTRTFFFDYNISTEMMKNVKQIIGVKDNDDNDSVISLDGLIVTKFYMAILRPNLRAILERLSRNFDLAISSLGVRDYIYSFVDALDPTRTLFSNRIMAREDLEELGYIKEKCILPNWGGPKNCIVIDDMLYPWNSKVILINISQYLSIDDSDLLRETYHMHQIQPEEKYILEEICDFLEIVLEKYKSDNSETEPLFIDFSDLCFTLSRIYDFSIPVNFGALNKIPYNIIRNENYDVFMLQRMKSIIDMRFLRKK